MAESSERSMPPMPDLMSAWKQMLDTQEETWSNMFQQMMGTEAFAASIGRHLDNVTNVQGTLEKTLDRHFRSLNLPSRADFTRLATEVADLRAAVAELSERVEELSDRIGPRPATPTPDEERPAKSRRTARASHPKAKETKK